MPLELTTNEANFGWVDADATDAHAYLLPDVLGSLTRLYGDRGVRILDLGCGNGYIAAQLARHGHQITGLDAARDGIDIARAKYPGLDFQQCSIYSDDWNIAADSFDCIVSLEVIEHLVFPKKLFAKSYSVIKDGGHLIISTPYHGYLKNLALSFANGWDHHFGVDWDGDHIKFFSKRTLSKMATDAGFKVRWFSGAGRLPFLWKSMLMIAEK